MVALCGAVVNACRGISAIPGWNVGRGLPMGGSPPVRPAGGHFGIHITLLRKVSGSPFGTFAGTNESNQSKVPQRQPFEPNASARKFGCCVKVRTRRLEALSSPQVFWADEPVMEPRCSSSTAFSFQPCNSIGWLAFRHFALPTFICASK